MTRTVIQLRVSPEEKAAIEAKAEAAGLSTSNYLRQQALAATATPIHRPPKEKVEDEPKVTQRSAAIANLPTMSQVRAQRAAAQLKPKR